MGTSGQGRAAQTGEVLRLYLSDPERVRVLREAWWWQLYLSTREEARRGSKRARVTLFAAVTSYLDRQLKWPGKYPPDPNARVRAWIAGWLLGATSLPGLPSIPRLSADDYAAVMALAVQGHWGGVPWASIQDADHGRARWFEEQGKGAILAYKPVDFDAQVAVFIG